jgi:long-subunit acyl-CoA synthetase (AMP-forming)
VVEAVRAASSLTVGYQRDDDTAPAMMESFYRTGDVAERDANGFCVYVGYH